jgi:hypothetical protein
MQNFWISFHLIFVYLNQWCMYTCSIVIVFIIWRFQVWFECHVLVWKELDSNILNKVINSEFVIAEEKFYKDYHISSSTKINNKLSRYYSDIVYLRSSLQVIDECYSYWEKKMVNKHDWIKIFTNRWNFKLQFTFAELFFISPSVLKRVSILRKKIILK